MRISIDKRDPGYVVGAERWSLEITLDGKPVPGCITADSDRGEIVVNRLLDGMTWASIMIPADQTEPPTYLYRGTVKILYFQTRRRF